MHSPLGRGALLSLALRGRQVLCWRFGGNINRLLESFPAVRAKLDFGLIRRCLGFRHAQTTRNEADQTQPIRIPDHRRDCSLIWYDRTGNEGAYSQAREGTVA